MFLSLRQNPTLQGGSIGMRWERRPGGSPYARGGPATNTTTEMPRQFHMHSTANTLASACVLACLLALAACTSAENKDDATYGVETHAIIVEQPSHLAGDYRGALGHFGVPLYGGSMAGRLVTLFDPADVNKEACEPFESDALHGARDADDGDDDLATVAIVRRGGCFFVTKALNAQSAGADALIVVDDRDEPLITMTHPEEEVGEEDSEAAALRLELVHQIRIPTALVARDVGERLRSALVDGDEDVILELSWRESIANPDGRVEWELWTTSNDGCGPSCDEQALFKRDVAAIAATLDEEGFTRFAPHFKTRPCVVSGSPAAAPASAECDRQCIHGGRYCALTSPKEGAYTGSDVVSEDKRQLCLYDFLASRDKRSVWWEYASAFAEQCTMREGSFGLECSMDLIRKLEQTHAKVLEGLEGAVSRCSDGDDDDRPHPLLEAQRQAETAGFRAGRGHVLMTPTLIINDAQYRGRLATGGVLRALCSGFQEGTEPAVCLQSTLQSNGCEASDACWRNPDPSLEDEHSAVCLDTFRGHLCMCPKGFMGDGYTCEDMNECTLGLASCDQRCVNTPGGYSCECEEGFTKVGETQCEMRDPCAENNGGCDHTCNHDFVNMMLHADCSCREGFQLDRSDRQSCLDVDECALGTDECEQVCINTHPDHANGRPYVCGCNDGYSVDMTDPLLRTCVSNDSILRRLGVPSSQGGQGGQGGKTLSPWEVVLISLSCVAVVTLAGLAFFKYHLKPSWDREIRGIIGNYVPLEDKPKSAGKAGKAGDPPLLRTENGGSSAPTPAGRAEEPTPA